MHPYSTLDLVALLSFVGAWLGYALLIELTPHGRIGLNGLMHRYRDIWMMRMLARDMRMMDGQVITALQSGTAFFASTSLIAIGGGLTLLHYSDEMLAVIATLPFGARITRVEWDVKVMGLVIIFIYAFFKFAWSYRLYNYVAIMIGAAPPAAEHDTREAKDFAHRTAVVITDAGRHFNRGQRAFFFALGYLGWFLGPVPLMLTTAGVVVVMWRRQFTSQSRSALLAADSGASDQSGRNRDE